MPARLCKCLTILVLSLSLGAHWALLQSVAWLGMVVNYSRDASMGEALGKTFDGKHPCSLCLAIAKGKKTEKKPDAQPASKKLEFAHASAEFLFNAPSVLPEVRLDPDPVRILTYRPLLPPPRPQAV